MCVVNQVIKKKNIEMYDEKYSDRDVEIINRLVVNE